MKYLTHDFFKNYSDLKYYNSIRPGYRVGDHVVVDIRALMYCPSGEIRYKLAMKRDFLDLPRRAKVSKLTGEDRVNNLHASSLPIKATKYKHLQELKVLFQGIIIISLMACLTAEKRWDYVDCKHLFLKSY